MQRIRRFMDERAITLLHLAMPQEKSRWRLAFRRGNNPTTENTEGTDFCYKGEYSTSKQRFASKKLHWRAPNR